MARDSQKIFSSNSADADWRLRRHGNTFMVRGLLEFARETHRNDMITSYKESDQKDETELGDYA